MNLGGTQCPGSVLLKITPEDQSMCDTHQALALNRRPWALLYLVYLSVVMLAHPQGLAEVKKSPHERRFLSVGPPANSLICALL